MAHRINAKNNSSKKKNTQENANSCKLLKLVNNILSYCGMRATLTQSRIFIHFSASLVWVYCGWIAPTCVTGFHNIEIKAMLTTGSFRATGQQPRAYVAQRKKREKDCRPLNIIQWCWRSQSAFDVCMNWMKKSERKKESESQRRRYWAMNTVAMDRKNTTTTTHTQTTKTKRTRKASKKSKHSQRQYHCFYIQKML